MPCSLAKARHLLERRRAKIVNLNPFAIKLTFDCENKVQEVSLGIDTGYRHIGFSAITEVKEIVSGEVELDDKTSKRLTERRMYRGHRRSRLRYRKPRFNNRKTSEGWLPPSIQRRLDTHINMVNKLKELTPVRKVTVEIGAFDIQKLMDPEISGKEYQHGDLYGYNNLKAFLFSRESGKCQLCNKKIVKGEKAHLHHIKPRSETGTDRPSNIALLHENCHDKMHKKKLYKKLKGPKEYKAETFMSIMAARLKKALDCDVTYGYETATKRNLLRIEKSHVNDALVIAGGTNQERCLPYKVEQKRINNRVLQTNRKGFIPSIRKKRHSIQNRDFVWINNKRYLCGGVASRGAEVYYFERSGKKLINTKKIEKVYHTGSMVWISGVVFTELV
jgi:5-methylcytosine-specific restriction endonuclease McrA